MKEKNKKMKSDDEMDFVYYWIDFIVMHFKWKQNKKLRRTPLSAD